MGRTRSSCGTNTMNFVAVVVVERRTSCGSVIFAVRQRPWARHSSPTCSFITSYSGWGHQQLNPRAVIEQGHTERSHSFISFQFEFSFINTFLVWCSDSVRGLWQMPCFSMTCVLLWCIWRTDSCSAVLQKASSITERLVTPFCPFESAVKVTLSSLGIERSFHREQMGGFPPSIQFFRISQQ